MITAELTNKTNVDDFIYYYKNMSRKVFNYFETE